MPDATTDILDEAEVYRLHAERATLQVQLDAVAARIGEIDRALVVSGEARLRARREAEEKFHRERCGACGEQAERTGEQR
jgi:hypothetical protein